MNDIKFTKEYRRRTIWIGLAFFGILLVWQLYNSYCSPMLSFLFAKADYAQNVIEGENFIEGLKALLSANNYAGIKAAFDGQGLTVLKDIDILTEEGQAAIAKIVNGLKPDMKFLLSYKFIEEQEYLSIQWKVGIIMALDNIAALFIMPIFGGLSDKTHTKLGKRMPYIIIGSVVTSIALPFIPLFFSKGMANAAVTGFIVGMIATMIVIIVFMMSYRSPAVALMPDLTPKPLRSKANGIINIVGYVGGAVGSVFAIVLPVTKFIDGSNKSLWMLEIPFIVCSVVLLVSLALLLYKVKENKLHEQLDEEIKLGDNMGESAEQVTESGKLSKVNKRNLILILMSVVIWYMAINAVETFQTNYVMFWLDCSSGGGAIMTVISGAASIVGFLVAGSLADKIGRKWTIFSGICVLCLCYVIYSFINKRTPDQTNPFAQGLPFIFFILLPAIGFGTSLIHICSFPLVTDYCTSDKLGKFTSLYYAASMLAQSITPICIGFIFQSTTWRALPIYSAILMGLAGLVFFFVKAPHNKDTGSNVKGLDALGADD